MKQGIKPYSMNATFECQSCKLIFTNNQHLEMHMCYGSEADYVEKLFFESLQIENFSTKNNEMSKMCRLCARISPHYTSILSSRDLITKISDMFTILIQDDSNISTSICVLCLNKLSKYYDFYMKTQASQVIFQKLLNSHDRHVAQFNMNNEIICDVPNCNRKFFDTVSFDNHIVQSHLSDLKYSCDICDEILSTEEQLHAHSQGHVTSGLSISETILPVSDFLKSNSAANLSSINNIEIKSEHDEGDRVKIEDIYMDNDNYEYNSNLSETSVTDSSENLKTRSCSYSKQKRKKRREVLKVSSKKRKREHSHKHVCNICGKILQSQNLLSRHTNTHTKREIVCGICSSVFNTFYEWFEHRKQDHMSDKKAFQCMACKKKFGSSTRLSSHVKGCIVVSVLRFKCKCENMYKDHATYLEHKKECKVITEGLISDSSVHDVETRRYECSCKHISPTFKKYLHHYRKKHIEFGILQCSECKKDFSNVSTLLSHNMDRHSESSFKCSKCEKTFKSLRALKTHINAHDKLNQHPCIKCGVSCTRYHNLVRHQTKSKYCSIKENPPKCYRCLVSFETSDELLSHIKDCKGTSSQDISTKTHRRTERCRDWICFVCGKILTTKFSLKTHELQHTGEKPFVCDTCGANFRSTANLLQHTKSMHMDKRLFACKLCDKRFKRPAHLRSHAAVHLDYKQHECDICFKRFKYIGDMKIHRKRHNDFGAVTQ